MSLTLQQSAERVGGHCWIERRMFERLGAWATTVESAAAKLVFDRHSQHAAWRAAQWWDRLPVLAQIEREALVRPPAGWAAAVVAAVEAAGSDPGDGAEPATLAVAYRVLLPRLAVRYDRHLGVTTAVADGPTVRTLHQARRDVRADWAEGEALLETSIVDLGTLGRVTEAVARAEGAFIG